MAEKENEKAKPTYEETDHRELATVESQRNEINLEEFPEGPYGAATNEIKPGKATGWEPDQFSNPTRFDYEDRDLHEGIERAYPGSDPKREVKEREDV